MKFALYSRAKALRKGAGWTMSEAVKVDAEALERLYSFDEALIRYDDKFDEALKTFEQNVTSVLGDQPSATQDQNCNKDRQQRIDRRPTRPQDDHGGDDSGRRAQ